MNRRDCTFRMLHTVSAADRSFDGNELGSIIEEFASVHGLPARWGEFRKSALGLLES